MELERGGQRHHTQYGILSPPALCRQCVSCGALQHGEAEKTGVGLPCCRHRPCDAITLVTGAQWRGLDSELLLLLLPLTEKLGLLPLLVMPLMPAPVLIQATLASQADFLSRTPSG